MKKFITSLLSLALVIGMCPAMIANAAIDGVEGEGTSDSPYKIADAADLRAVRDAINANANGEADACYLLMENITLPEGENWTPIAPYSTVPFTGTFDGNNHVISNINIELNDTNYSSYTSRPYLGFFGTVGDSGTVTNLGLSDVSVVNNLDYIQNTSTCSWNGRPNALGGFAGDVSGDSVFTGCFVKDATIENNSKNGTYMNIGGFFGTTTGGQNPQFTNCYVYDATISAGVGSSQYRDTIGGFAGTPANVKTTFTNCYVAQTFTTQASSEKTAFYAFARLGTSTATTATNCYAEADDIATVTDAVNGSGEHKTNWDYDTTKSLGTVGMTKVGLVEAMTAVGYSTDATVNDGYPCFEWELSEDTLTGTGSETDPYIIESASDLVDAKNAINADTEGTGARDAYYEVTADIDMTGVAWTPIAPYSDYEFTGDFNGKGHVIKNLSMTVDNTYVSNNFICTAGESGNTAWRPSIGFFGKIGIGAKVYDLGLENANLQVTATWTLSTTCAWQRRFSDVGVFAGMIKGASVERCFVKDAVLNYGADQKPYNGIGGFVGSVNEKATAIADCYVDGLVMTSSTKDTQYASLAGFYGLNEKVAATLTNCFVNDATVTFNGADDDGVPGAKASFYGVSGSTTGLTSVNVYSAVADIQGTYYSETTSRGENKTISEIAEIFTGLEDTNWKSGAGINESGAPALAWETAPVVVVADPYVVKSVSLAKGTVTLTVNNATEGDQVCIAAYDSNDRLIAAEFTDVAASVTTTVASSADVAKVKVFVWNGLTPVINAVEKDLY